MGWALEAGETGYKFSNSVWDGIIDLTVEAGRPVAQLRGLPHGSTVDLPDGVVEDLDESLRLALESGKPFSPGGDPAGVDDQLVLTRDTIHRVRHVLRSGTVRLAWFPPFHIGEDIPDAMPSG
jgi:hypothetical protein